MSQYITLQPISFDKDVTEGVNANLRFSNIVLKDGAMSG
jgi:hypothetical protein